MYKALCIGLLAFTAAAGCSQVKTVDILNFVLPAGHYARETLQFGSDTRLTMDVYKPKATTNKPVIIFVYGGAWKMGEKSEYKFVAHALVGLGHPVIIPNYRLYPNVTFPAFVDDIANAIAYAQAHPQQIGVNLDEQGYVLMGHSSGAHTAALLATRQSFLTDRGVLQAPLALIGLSGPYDLPLEDPEVTPVFDGATPNIVNPLLNVTNQTPRTLLLHGAEDVRVLPKHSKMFAAALEQHSVPLSLRIYSGVDHVKIIASVAAPLRFLNKSYDDIATFLETAAKEQTTRIVTEKTDTHQRKDTL